MDAREVGGAVQDGAGLVDLVEVVDALERVRMSAVRKGCSGRGSKGCTDREAWGVRCGGAWWREVCG
ncbi:hypothetical protein [Streptomyces flavofungini]|uniref:hypothetical protein n=1 Tax=Streptomyces flavofungini TaxID=68200 RepID=UPI0025B0EC9E|nr:hypothetical protein [Streptomyces flavofungini]WJV44406.1 hypothetical protein QUY26_01960 [Streptomyces flavofungini]